MKGDTGRRGVKKGNEDQILSLRWGGGGAGCLAQCILQEARWRKDADRFSSHIL